MGETTLERRPRLDGRSVALMLLLCLAWGVQGVSTKLAAQQGLPPLMQAATRSIGAACLVFGWVWLTRGPATALAMLRIDRSFPPGLCIGILFTVEFVLVFDGLTRTTASHAILLLYTAPFFTAAGAHIWVPGERLHRRQVLGLACAFAGVAIAAGAGGGGWVGDAMIVVAAALWGMVNVVIRRSSGLRGQTAPRILLYQLGPSAALLLAVSAATGSWEGVGAASALAWSALAYQTVIVAFASYLTWFWLMGLYRISDLSAFTMVTPLFGILAGGIVLGETLSWALCTGFALVAAGLSLVNAPRRSLP